MQGYRWCVLALGGFFLATTAQAQGDGQAPAVVSFDWGASDTLAALGLEAHLVGLPHQAAPPYVASLLAGRIDVGGLKTPDLEAVGEAAPDLILVTGRQSEAREALSTLAEVQDVTLAGDDYFASLSDKVLGLAAPFGAQEEAAERLEALRDHIEALRRRLPDDLQAAVVTHNDGRYSLRQEPVVADLLRIDQPALPSSVVPVTRGTRTFHPMTPAAIAEMAPDALFVVDRSAAIGEAPLDVADLEAALAEEGGEAIDVTLLSPALWYLSGDGLQSVREQVEEVVDGLSLR